MAKEKMDPRFQRVLKDPRFKKVPRNERKVKIDSRFSKMFTDERFHTKSTVDKRGRVIKESNKEDLRKFYDVEDEESEEGGETFTQEELLGEGSKAAKKSKGKEKKPKEKVQDERKKAKTKLQESSGESSSEEEEDENDFTPDFSDIRGEGIGHDMSSDSSSDEEDEIVDFDQLQEGVVHGWGELDEEARRIEDAETPRIAVCNCDWDRIKANDLFVLFNSFKPTGGAIKSVKIYVSDFGEERLKEEELKGPKELRESKQDSDEEDGDQEENAEGSKYDMEKLREYQLNRMKYYYAVVECSDKDTADKIYEQCDGMEYELSGTRLDLRFVPDDMTFDKEPTSEANELPNVQNYQPASFLNTALQQSTVRLTWDEDDPKRLQSTMRQFTREDLENMDFKDYIASSSDEEDITKSSNNKKAQKHKQPKEVEISEDEESDEDNCDEKERIKKYRQLMDEINAKERQNENDDDGDGNMEVTWSMEDQSSFKKAKDNDEDVSEGENSTSGEEEAESDDEEALRADGDDDDGFDDPFFSQPSEMNEKISASVDDENENIINGVKNKNQKKKKKKAKKDSQMTEEELKQKNELELLLLGDETTEEQKKHFSLKGIMEQEKNTKKNNKRKKRKLKEEQPEDDFVFNTKDERFNALYDSHLFSLDPSEPNFKKTKATEAIIGEAQKRRENRAQERTEKVKYNTNSKNDVESKSSSTKDMSKASLSALVKSVKSKTQNHQAQKQKRKLR
eukprot:TCONS_00013904-protein